MDIKEIDFIIQDLENSNVTMQSVRDLAALYIVRDNLKIGIKRYFARL